MYIKKQILVHVLAAAPLKQGSHLKTKSLNKGTDFVKIPYIRVLFGENFPKTRPYYLPDHFGTGLTHIN